MGGCVAEAFAASLTSLDQAANGTAAGLLGRPWVSFLHARLLAAGGPDSVQFECSNVVRSRC
jgi:hypothetical protein